MADRLRRRALRMIALSRELGRKALERSRPAQAAPARWATPAGSGDVAGLAVMVTGGTRGIGRAVARSLAREGCKVAVLGRSAEGACDVAAAIGEGTIGVAMDVTDTGSIERAFDRVIAEFGRVDLLINGAGTSGQTDTPAWETSTRDFASVLAVNATGVFAVSTEAIRRMRRCGGGRIINVSSGAVDRAVAGMSAYGASKHALEGVTRQLAADAAPHGIAVCALRLGSVRTEMTERAFGKISASMLPEPETVVPAFRALATAPPAQISGRSFAGWRLLADARAELHAPLPLSAAKPFAYPGYTFNGRTVERDDPAFRIYDRAENGFGPSPRVAERLARVIAERPMAIYPDESHGRLKSALAERFELSPQHFVIGNGSWELLDRLLEVLTLPGDEVVCGKPGWFGFNMLCGKRGIWPIKTPMRRVNGTLSHDLDAVAAAVTPGTRLIYLITPSNPEGVVLHRDPFRAFLDKLPEGLPVLLDEAYFEFCDDDAAVSVRDLLDRDERPVLGLRTFSKFHALASMRVGYAYGRPEYVDLLQRGERIFNISHLSEEAAIAALADEAHHAVVHDGTREARARIETRFAELGLDYIPSQAPFVLVELPAALGDVVQRFAEQGIFIGEKAFYKGKYLLFPVATPPENERNLEILASSVDGRA